MEQVEVNDLQIRALWEDYKRKDFDHVTETLLLWPAWAVATFSAFVAENGVPGKRPDGAGARVLQLAGLLHCD